MCLLWPRAMAQVSCTPSLGQYVIYAILGPSALARAEVCY